MFKCYCVSDKGNIKEVNQDSFGYVISVIDGKEAVFAVMCDGVGGLNGGEIASRDTVRCFLNWFQYEFSQIVQQEKTLNITDNALKTANNGYAYEDFYQTIEERLIKIAIYQNERIHKAADNNKMRMGTTLTALLIYDEVLLTVQVGDSRAYAISNGAIIQLTKDQSLVQYEVEKGILTASEAKTDKRKNVILQSIGSANAVKPVVCKNEVQRNAIYILCTDGLSNLITEDEIVSALSNGRLWFRKPQKCLEDLVTLAKKRGERDNISIMALINI